MGRRTTTARRDADEQQESPSQRLLEAALRGEVERVEECLAAAAAGSAVIDVNYVGTVSLRTERVEAALREEAPAEVRVVHEEFRTDVTPLFAAAHAGHAEIVRKLLSAGADVNEKLFRGYATTAAAREGNCSIMDMFLKAGASMEACEDALYEASLCGKAEAVQKLICSEMVRPDAAVHALVTASSRGFVEVVATLIKNGVDKNCMARVLLQSVRPSLHANVDCTPLVAAIISRQISTVQYLLEIGASIDFPVNIGAWSWDPVSGEEVRVGACLGEAYNAAWCAIEYYEATGQIIKLLLACDPCLLENPHLGRTLLCHAILCQNINAVCALLDAGANTKFPIQTKNGNEFRPIHLAARLGCVDILRQLISNASDINARTSMGETPLMISAKHDHADCFQELLLAGADLGLVSSSGDSTFQLAKRSVFGSSLIDIISHVLKAGLSIKSSNFSVFSPLHFVAASGCVEPLQMILHSSSADLNKLDGSGFTPLMIAAKSGHAEVFRLLVMAGADIGVRTADGESVLSIIQHEVTENFGDTLKQILLSAVLANVITGQKEFRALHYASCKGDTAAITQLLKMGYHVNDLDEDGYSPLMLAAKEGHSNACKVLLSQGNADCSLSNDQNETAISLARSSSKSSKVTEDLLLDHIARSHVLAGAELCKHTREGRGTPHIKAVRMLKSGVLTWGRTNRRNVICKEATAGPSLNFLKNRRLEEEDDKKFIFRVITRMGREIHFEASSASEMDIWVRGINIFSKESALSSTQNGANAK